MPASAATSPASGRTRPYRSETRRRVLDAALATFGERGIAGTSLTQVAAAAGLTKGAVYSSFASKDDLVLALMEEHAADRIDAAVARFTDDGGTDRGVAGAAAALVDGMRADAAWHRLLAEYFALSHFDPDRRQALRDRRREVREAVVRALDRVSAELGVTFVLPSEEMAVVLLALSNGLAMEGDIDPAAVPDDLLGRVLAYITSTAVADRPSAS